MHLQQKFVILLLLIFSALSVNAQDCKQISTTEGEKERAIIPGETMGQKLESLLFWSQAEREKRFSMMHEIFPSIAVKPGSKTLNLKHAEEIVPQWQDKTTLNSYIKENHIVGLLVLQGDTIRLEKYANGFKKENLWTSFSMAKSVSSMLLGVALQEGAIESLDDALEKYIPELKGYDYGKVSVRQLLTMTSGIDWNEDYEDPESDVAQMYQNLCENNESHILTYMKPLKFAHEPGTHWNYSTGETDLVGILIQKATGKSLAEYLSEKIWQPYGMENCAYWLADECSNLNIGGSGLSASLGDYARLGRLMLEQSKLDGEQLFSKAYIKDATSLLYETNGNGSGYGYLWWRFKNGSYAAVGIFGQMLYVDPQKDLVIVQLAAWPKASSKKLVQSRRNFIQAVERVVD